MFEKIRRGKREKCCWQCFAYIPTNSRKCKHCGIIFKSPGKYLFDKIKQVLKIEEVHSVEKSKRQRESIFFTAREIEYLFDTRHYQILMYLVLNDMKFLDESSLIELGETLSEMDNI